MMKSQKNTNSNSIGTQTEPSPEIKSTIDHAESLLNAGNIAEALILLNQAQDTSPSDLFMSIAKIYHVGKSVTKNRKKAFELYNQALSLEESDSKIYIKLLDFDTPAPANFHQIQWNYLNHGSYGKVYKTENKNLNMCLKVSSELLSSPVRATTWLHEIIALKELQTHTLPPFIIHMHAAWTDGDQGFLLMQRCGNNLYELLCHNGNISFDHIGTIINGICHGISFIHQHGVIHRDIKTTNILVSVNNGAVSQVKLCDFGSSTLTHNTTLNYMCAELKDSYKITTAGRCPPECYPEHQLSLILNKKVEHVQAFDAFLNAYHMYDKHDFIDDYQRQHSFQVLNSQADKEACSQITVALQKIDIFSLGVLLFEMLSFAPALRHETNNHTLTQILEPALTHACDRMHEPFTVAKNCYSFFAQHNLISSDNLSDLTAKASLQQ